MELVGGMGGMGGIGYGISNFRFQISNWEEFSEIGGTMDIMDVMDGMDVKWDLGVRGRDLLGKGLNALSRCGPRGATGPTFFIGRAFGRRGCGGWIRGWGRRRIRRGCSRR